MGSETRVIHTEIDADIHRRAATIVRAMDTTWRPVVERALKRFVDENAHLVTNQTKPVPPITKDAKTSVPTKVTDQPVTLTEGTTEDFEALLSELEPATSGGEGASR